jgi:hypothetical protein
MSPARLETCVAAATPRQPYAQMGWNIRFPAPFFHRYVIDRQNRKMTDQKGVPAQAPAYRTTRMEAFSDGVFAIAITLLVLEIAVPSGPRPLRSVEPEGC